MTAFLQDPRRSPRVPVKLHAAVAFQGATCRAFTEDVGPAGCLVVTPTPLVQGGAVVARLLADPIGRLTAAGRVQWVRGQRAGIAFGAEQVGVTAAWFARLREARPELDAMVSRLPTQLAMDAVLYLLPPSPDLRFGPDELAVIRAVDRDVTVARIVEFCRLPVARAARAIFALLQSNVLTLAASRAVEPWVWNPIVYPSTRAAREEPAVAAQPPVGEEQPGPARTEGPGPIDPETAIGRVALKSMSASVALHALLRGTHSGGRSEEAQGRLDLARAAIARGRVGDAMALLREALRHAPRDREISGVLAQVALTRRVA